MKKKARKNDMQILDTTKKHNVVRFF